jgi:micrococcal nuclease
VRRVLLVVAVLLLAGCVTVVPSGTPDGPATAASGSPAPAGTAHPDVAPTERATVTRVIDGDTVEVRLADGTEETVRLLGVDTPEVHAENTPDEYEDVPGTAAGRDCLRRYGERASAFAERELAGRAVGLGFDPREDRRGYYGRLLAYVYVDGEQFNARLVASGRARVYDSDVVERARYTRLEGDARAARRGLWTCAADPVADDGTPVPTEPGTATRGLSLVVAADAPGDDRENLDGERVRVVNERDESVDLSGWTLRDEAGHVYEFPDGTRLARGEAVVVHTGSGTDGGGDLYWGRSRPVWNNDGDTATLRDADGRVRAERSY